MMAAYLGPFLLRFLRNKIYDIAKALSPAEIKAMIDQNKDFIWLDGRSHDEHKKRRIEDPWVKLIPVGRLPRRLNELPKDKKIVT
jgi:hypothetical protein